MMRKIIQIFILALICLPLSAQNSYKLQQNIPIDPNVRMGKLPNGMRYYIKGNEKPENRAELRLAVNAGAMQEDDDQLGLAHFVEHMAFNGSKHFEKNELVDYLESIGTRFGPDLNAYTSFDETVYMLQSRTDSLELLSKGLLILEDWANGVSFDSVEIDKERGVVISEWRSRLSPDQRMQQKYFPILYQGARYAKRLPIGDPEIINNADYETIKRFYKDWYRPELMAIVAVGDFDVNWMEAELIERFGKIPAASAKLRTKASEHVPGHNETLYAICSDKEAAFTRAQVVFKHPKQPLKTVEDYKRSLARGLYNRMLSSRLFELQQQANPPFTFASTGYGSNVGDLDTYYASVFVGEGKINEGLGALLTEVRRAMLHGFTASELERKKTEMLKSAERAFKEQDKTESGTFAQGYVYHFLDESIIPDATQRYELVQQLLPLISLEEINALPKQWITDENRVVIVTAPEKEETPLPTEEDMAELLKILEKEDIEPYVDNVSDEPLLSEKLYPKPIITESYQDTTGITELTLSNSIKIALKPTDFKNDEIIFSAYSPGGHSLYSDEDYFSASTADALVNLAGLSQFNLTELQKKLSGKVVRVNPYIGELNEGFSGSCSPDDLETMLQLIYLYFKKPRKDETALQSFLTRQKSVYENILTNPYYYFSEEMNKIKYDNHLRRGMPTVEQLESISIDRAFEIYQERFADASDFTFALVGNFEVEKIKPLLATYLGNLPTIERKEQWKDVGADLKKGRIEKTIVRGEAPKSLVYLTYHGPFEYEAQNRYDFYSTIALLRIKLRESMREDQGGVYGVRVSGNARQFPKPGYTINISFNAEPDQVDTLIATAMADIQKLQQDGPELKDVQKVQETQRQNKIKNLKENSYWLGQIMARYKDGVGMSGITYEAYEKFVDRLDAKAIQNAMQQYFSEANFMKMILLPESTSEE
jgi:zinc protease